MAMDLVLQLLIRSADKTFQDLNDFRPRIPLKIVLRERGRCRIDDGLNFDVVPVPLAGMKLAETAVAKQGSQIGHGSTGLPRCISQLCPDDAH